MFFSLLFKEKNLNPFDLHMHPVNDQICQAVKSRRRPVARGCRATGKALATTSIRMEPQDWAAYVSCPNKAARSNLVQKTKRIAERKKHIPRGKKQG